MVKFIRIFDQILQITRIYTILGFITSIIPKNKKVWVWTSFPIHSDSPFIFYQYCKENYPNVRHVWINVRSSKVVNNSIETYNIYSIKAIYFLFTCKVIFSNNNEFFRFKSENQLLIDFWHGVPIKSILNYDFRIDNLLVTHAYRTNYRITPSRFVTAILSSSFGNKPSKYIEGVYIRSDRILSEPEFSINNLLGIPKEKRVALYMPTYRQGYRTKRDGKEEHFESDFLYQLKEVLDEKGMTLVVKPHPFEEKLYTSNLNVITSEILSKNSLTVSDLLSSVDFLISDYSSIVIDYLITDKPMIIYTENKIGYKESRGFTFDLSLFMEEITARSTNELLNLIKSTDLTARTERSFLKKLYFENNINTKNSQKLTTLLNERRPDIF